MDALFEKFVNAIKSLYENFVLRDILGKFIPGLIVIVGLLPLVFTQKTLLHNQRGVFTIFNALQVVSGQLTLNSNGTVSFLFWLTFISVAYIIGYCNQTLSESIGIHSAHPIPKYIFYYKRKKGRIARDKFEKRLPLMRIDEVITPRQRQQRERYLIIKEMSGNMVIPFLVITGLTFRYNVILTGIFFIFALLIWHTHRNHRDRQYKFEAQVLRSLEPDVLVRLSKCAIDDLVHSEENLLAHEQSH